MRERIVVRGGRVEGQALDLGLDPSEGRDVFRDGAEIVGCRLTFHYPATVLIFCSALTGCTLHARRRAVRLNWQSVYFRNCVFTGRFYDTRFGLTSPQADICTHAGGLADCDFSGAGLHLCSFFNCDPATLRFPPWPHFTVLRPQQNAADWMATPFPDWFRISQKVIAEQHSSCAAVTDHWPTYAKEAKDTTDPEAIRQLLVGKDYVVM